MKILRPSWIAAALATATLCCLVPALKRAGGSPAVSKVEKAGAKGEPVRLGAKNKASVQIEESPGKTTKATLIKEGGASAQIAALLTKEWDVTDAQARRTLLDELQRLERVRGEETAKKAAELGLPLVTEGGAALVDFQGELPLYDISHNANAAISTNADVLLLPPYEVDGYGRKIGLWDVSYAPSDLHQELEGNIDIKDNAIPGGLHATHVAATMIGKGIDPLAKGMAPKAKIWAYSSTDVLTELAAAASTDDGDFGNLFVSVHPYGAAAGWENWSYDWYGTFSDDGDPSNDFVPIFGQYSSTTASWDGLVKSFPYHLMVKSSGNHADDEPPQGEADDGGEEVQDDSWGFGGGEYGSSSSSESAPWWSLNGTSTWYQYDALTHPEGDGKQYNVSPSGFGTIDARASAKNILTVGSVRDAVTGGVRDLSRANLSDFSSAGPTDDGRIKPDVLANGETIYSADAWTTDRYFLWSGTSMAAASAGGTALLLVDLQKDLSGKALQASTLKGLLIHTADDLGNPGPDYRHGWGLINAERAAQLLVDHGALQDLAQARLAEESLLSESDSDYFVIEHDGTSPLRVTLCWTDEPGSWTSSHDNRSPRLVNDLNLRLMGPDSTTYYPYVMPFTSTFAPADLDAPAVTGVNTVDNVEQIFLANAPAGQYTIHVDLGGALTGSIQEYSLLLSGSVLPGAGVEVEFPVADQGYLVLNDDKIGEVADVDDVFTGQDHTYGISWTPASLLSDATIAGDGKVDLFPTATVFGTVDVTLTALDATGGFASDTFKVTLRPATMFVDMNSPAAPEDQDGATWATAYRHLQDGLAGAVEGQEIWVAQGIYYPDVDSAGDTDDRARSFAMVRKVPMFGGFAGGETSREERDPALHLTILSGDIAQDDEQQPIASRVNSNSGDGNNSYRVVDLSACYGTEVFDGFVVTAGRADVGPDHADGAGIFVMKDVEIRNCLISGNYAASGGGGLYVFDNNPIVSRCRIVGNEAENAGGGIYFNDGYSDFFNCEIRGNEASDGGGIFLGDAKPDFQNCVVSGNSGFFGGGGVHMAAGELNMVNCTLTGNFTNGSGGALHISGAAAKPEIRNSIIWKNKASGSAGLVISTVYFADPYDAPKFRNSIVDNSGGSMAWNPLAGIDEEGNLDTNPDFVDRITANSRPRVDGDFGLTASSPALNGALEYHLLDDKADLDGDGDTGEKIEVDLAGNARLVSAEVDMGAYEFADLTLIDADGDGLSDEFELRYGGALGIIDADSDEDGDGLTAMAEFVHGLDPNAPLSKPIAAMETTDYAGTEYLTMTFEVDPVALNFATYTVERRGALNSPQGWEEGKAIEISSGPSPTNPGMLEVTFRSLVPFGQDRMEFMRLRHDSLGN